MKLLKIVTDVTSAKPEICTLLYFSASVSQCPVFSSVPKTSASAIGARREKALQLDDNDQPLWGSSLPLLFPSQKLWDFSLCWTVRVGGRPEGSGWRRSALRHPPGQQGWAMKGHSGQEPRAQDSSGESRLSLGRGGAPPTWVGGGEGEQEEAGSGGRHGGWGRPRARGQRRRPSAQLF